MYRSTTPAHRLSSPSTYESYLTGTYSVPSGSQVSEWAAHRSALSSAVAEHPRPRRRRASRPRRATVAQAV